MSAANGRLEAYDILPARDAKITAAQILKEQIAKSENAELTDAEEIALAHALAMFVEAQRWTP
jgi:hypothetical protein